MKKTLNHVWLIDDNEIDNFINKKMILKFQFALSVKEFNSASSAELFLTNLLTNKTKNNEIPDLIFLDLNMPVCSGTDFIKKNENHLLMLNPGIGVVILTSSVNPNDKTDTCTFKTFRAYTNKPLNEENLSEIPLLQ